MVGRKRKSGKARFPSGKIKPDKPMSAEQIVQFQQEVASTMPHRMALPRHRRHDQMAESPFGALCIIGAITQIQFDAGHEYRKIVQRYRAVISAPNPNPQAPKLGHIKSSIAVLLDDEQAIARREKYMRAFEAITTRWGRTVINSVVIHDRQLQQGDLPWLTRSLDELARHFGMGERQKVRIA